MHWKENLFVSGEIPGHLKSAKKFQQKARCTGRFRATRGLLYTKFQVL